jgi:hypothetical protein
MSNRRFPAAMNLQTAIPVLTVFDAPLAKSFYVDCWGSFTSTTSTRYIVD